MIDISKKSLRELEGDWGTAPENVSGLVVRCHELRKKKIGEMSTEDLRLMIGQNIGIQYLVPKAIELLKQNPLAEGDFYEGDLLYSVLKSDPKFWNDHPRYKEEVLEIYSRAEDLFSDYILSDEVINKLRETKQKFI